MGTVLILVDKQGVLLPLERDSKEPAGDMSKGMAKAVQSTSVLASQRIFFYSFFFFLKAK